MICILFYFHGLKQREISIVIKTPEGTVKSRLSTSRKLLKEFMEEDTYG